MVPLKGASTNDVIIDATIVARLDDVECVSLAVQ